jgi:hypothetical protein
MSPDGAHRALVLHNVTAQAMEIKLPSPAMPKYILRPFGTAWLNLT